MRQSPDLIDVAHGKPQHGLFPAPGGGVAVIVDLLTTYPLGCIYLADNSAAPLIEVSADGVIWTPVVLSAAPVDTTDAPDCAQGRYVRLTGPVGWTTLSQRLGLSVWLTQKQATVAEQVVENIPLSGSALSDGPSIPAVVLGTSNSVNRGYVDGLEPVGIKVLRNLSLGSSHMTLAGYRLSGLAQFPAQVLLLDLHVVEQRALGLGHDFTELAGQVLDHVACWCAQTGMVPVFLIMPARLPYANNTRVHVDRYIQMCRERGIPWFDGYRFLDALSELWGRPPLSLIPDDAHLNRLAARCLAVVMGQQIRNRLGPALNGGVAFQRETVVAPAFSHVGISGAVDGVEIIERRTSLLVETLVRLREGDSVTFDAPAGSCVVGLILNMAQTNGSLRIEGDGTLVKRLDNRFYRPDIQMWLVTWGLHNPLPVGMDGKVRVTCLSSKELSAPYEDNDHRMGWEGFANDHPPIVELMGLILRHPPAPRERLVLAGIDPDLSHDMDMSIIANGGALPEGMI